jgi:hypothetical protein
VVSHCSAAASVRRVMLAAAPLWLAR